MKLVEKYISIAFSDLILTEKINKLGFLNEKLGCVYFIKPTNNEFKAISIVVIDTIVQNIGITFNDNLSLTLLENEFNSKPSLGYSHYDDLSYFTFKFNGYYYDFRLDGHYMQNVDLYLIGKKKILSDDVLFNNVIIRRISK